MWWGWITKDIYDKKLTQFKESQYRLGIELEEHTKADHEYHIHVATVLNLSRKMKDIFESSEVHEKRAILNFLLQNPTVLNKKLEFTLKKPFDTVLTMASAKDRPTLLPHQEIIITLLLDRKYLQNTYKQFNFLKQIVAEI